MSISYFEDEGADEDIDIDDVQGCSDRETLAGWFLALSDTYDQVKAVMVELRDAGYETERLVGMANKCAFARIGMKRVERRMLTLGFEVAYPPADPRTKQIRMLEGAIKKLRRQLLDNGIEPETGEPAQREAA